MQKSAEKYSSIEISPKQEKLIAALVAGNTIAVSAKVAGISERTAYNWLKEPAFKEAYRVAKQSIFEDALDKLRNNVNIAIETLKRNMGEDVRPYVQVMAAGKWLDIAIELHKTQELEERLKELEDAIKGMQS